MREDLLAFCSAWQSSSHWLRCCANAFEAYLYAAPPGVIAFSGTYQRSETVAILNVLSVYELRAVFMIDDD